MPYLIILGAGPDQVPAYQEAKSLGIKTIGVDYNPDAPGFKHADLKCLASIKNKDEIISSLKRLDKKYSGVITLGAEVSPEVAAVTKTFSLIGVSETTAFLTTNKCARNEVLRKSGIPIPDFQIIGSADDSKMDFPFVIKPSDNSASRGVQVVDSKTELHRIFDTVKDLSSDGQVLIEEKLSGPEISIEGFMLNGKMHVTGFADRNYSRNSEFYPLFVEDGGDYPSCLSQQVQNEAKKIFEAAAKALEIENGPSKGDLIVTSKGVRVIEITSRLSGGGFCSRIVPLQTGVNIVNATIKWACGQTVNETDFLPRWNKGLSHRFFFHTPGKIKSIKGLETIKDMPGITDVVIQRPFRKGDILEEQTYANRLFYIIAVAGDRKTAIDYAQNAINSVQIEVE